MPIRVMLNNQIGDLRQQAKLDENASVERLIRGLVTALKQPVTDDAGRPITYHLAYNGRRLQEDETLTSAGVQENETITLIADMTAGFALDSSAPLPQQPLVPLVALEPAIDTWRPISGFPPEYQVDTQTDSIQVWLSPDAMQQIWIQARTSPQQEVGGVLIGKVYEEERRFLVKVEHILEAQHTIASPVFLTFTGETGLDILKRRSTYPASDVLGWYHSHPGLGIFLSTSDQFIHRIRFGNRPWYLALVVDPSSDDWGVFTWENGEIIRCSKR